MFQQISSRFAVTFAVFVCLAGATAHALERVTYTSGMEDTFSHHVVNGDTTRFYKSVDDQSFVEVKTERIAAIVAETDPLPVVAAKPDELKPTAPRNAAKPTMDEMKAMLAQAGEIRNVDPDLLASVVKIESGFRTDARSRAGATGLMQLMPATAKQLGVDAKRAEDNIKGGAAYFDALLKQYHDDLRLALAAYNAGPAAVAKYHGVPPYRETQWYIVRVIREYNSRVKLREAAAMVAAR